MTYNDKCIIITPTTTDGSSIQSSTQLLLLFGANDPGKNPKQHIKTTALFLLIMLMPYTNLYIFKSFVFLAIVKCQAFALR
jgi:hypothetical protein